MAEVFESVTFGPSRRKWQDGIQTVKGLNGTLFIDTENSRMSRRLQIETDDSGRLLLELGVIADHVVATPVRLQPRLGPHPGHTHMVDAERGPQLAAAPMGRTIGRLSVQTPVDDPGFEFLDSFTGRTSTVPTPESGRTLSLKRSRHIRTVLILQRSSGLIAQRLREPKARLGTILARRASSARTLRLRLMR